MATVFVLTFILCFLLTSQAVNYAETQQISMQIVESFVFTFGDGNSVLLVTLLLLLLYADMPFITDATPFFLIRGDRKSWILGQLVYVLISAFFYLGFVLFSTCILSIRVSYVANIWSPTALKLAYADKHLTGVLPITVKVLEMSRPYQTMTQIFGLLLLYILVLVFLMMLLCICRGQIAGVCGVLGVSSFGLLTNPENIQKVLDVPEVFLYKIRLILGWISPLNHATFGMHSFGYDKLPSIWQSYCVFGVVLILLAWEMKHSIKRYRFQFVGTTKMGGIV